MAGRRDGAAAVVVAPLAVLSPVGAAVEPQAATVARPRTPTIAVSRRWRIC